MLADWLGWGTLSITEQLNVIRDMAIGAMTGLGLVVLFGWSPRRPTTTPKAKAKKKPAKKRGRRR